MEDRVQPDVTGKSAVEEEGSSGKMGTSEHSQIDRSERRHAGVSENQVLTGTLSTNTVDSNGAGAMAESERTSRMSEPNMSDNVTSSMILNSDATHEQTLQTDALPENRRDEKLSVKTAGPDCSSSAQLDRALRSASSQDGVQSHDKASEDIAADVQHQVKGTVKCAGCGKVFSQACVLPRHSNRTVVLSLCDDCENITSAMFVCISCGKECSSLAALCAHKQTHVVQEQRVFFCEMCGTDFPRQVDLEVHECPVSRAMADSLLEDKRGDKNKIEMSSDQTRNELSTGVQVRRPLRKVSRKVRVEDIVNTLTKKTHTVPKITQKPDDTPKKMRGRPKTKSVLKPAQEQKKFQMPPILKTTSSTRTRKIPAIRLGSLNPVSKPKPPKRKRKAPQVNCSECSEFFTDSKEYKKHKLIHRKKDFPCKTCPKKFKTKAHLVNHEFTHSESRENICDICNKNFQSPQSLFTHKKTIHSDDKPFVCDICQKAFKQLGNMKTHRRTHTGERPFICKECGRSFAQMGNLQAHMVIHASSKPHVCEICGKSFSYLRSLQNHRRGTHTGERPYSCGICGKTFSNPSVLRDHKRTHSDKRGYLCDKCGKGFKSYKNLKQHEKFHLDVRPYACDVCGKGFVWFKSFQLHKRTHTGEKPYSCDQCDKVFSNTNSLKNHKQKHLLGLQAPLLPSKVVHSRILVPPPASDTPPSPSAQPPLSPTSLANQAVLISAASFFSRQPRDHGEASSQSHPLPQPQASSTLPTGTPVLQQSLPSHTQAYSHVVFPQPFTTYVSSASGDFTIL